MGKWSYFLRSVEAQFVRKRYNCPNCGSNESELVARKYVVTQLRRCKYCQLMFRTPTDDSGRNETFYDQEYSQGFTTELPNDEALRDLKRTNFSGTEKDYSYYISIVKQLGIYPGMWLFDFGCSWGYGSFQFANSGFNVVAFEVARGRRRFAKKSLGINTVDEMDATVKDLAGKFDCFFSAHVIEHVPSPGETFEYAMRLLKEGGIFVSFTPNGSEAFRQKSRDWRQLWGEVHPNLIDDVFLNSSFASAPRLVGSSPVTDACLPATAEMRQLDALDGGELLFAARKVGKTWR